jgi:hypothetical protein
MVGLEQVTSFWVDACRVGLQDGKSDGLNWQKARTLTLCKLIGNDPELRLE